MKLYFPLINTFERVKMKGSDDDFILIEYEHGEGPMVSYPFKYQIILSFISCPIKLYTLYASQSHENLQKFAYH